MIHRLSPLLLAAVATLAATAVAIAGTPTPGATYKGTALQGVTIKLKVGGSGKKLTFTAACRTDHATIQRVKIGPKGGFKVEQPMFTARGKFKSATKATGTIEGGFCFVGRREWTATKQ
jgi:hypothetical protein